MKLLFIALCVLLGLCGVLLLSAILPAFPTIGPGYDDWVMGGLFAFIGTIQLRIWWRTPPGKFRGIGPWWASFNLALGLTHLFRHSGSALLYGAHLLVFGLSLRAVVIEWRKAWWSGVAVGAAWAIFVVMTATDVLSIQVPRNVERAVLLTLLCGGAAWLVAKFLANRRSSPVEIRSEL